MPDPLQRLTHMLSPLVISWEGPFLEGVWLAKISLMSHGAGLFQAGFAVLLAAFRGLSRPVTRLFQYTVGFLNHTASDTIIYRGSRCWD
jgi:hypothetical protein